MTYKEFCDLDSGVLLKLTASLHWWVDKKKFDKMINDQVQERIVVLIEKFPPDFNRDAVCMEPGKYDSDSFDTISALLIDGKVVHAQIHASYFEAIE